MTNGDRIRQMSNEEMAEKLVNDYEDYSEIKCEFCIERAIACKCDCKEGIKAYLESEVE